MFQFTSGSILGRYELLLPIASGGMAEVWAARLHGTRGFTKLVAIKTIRRGVMDDTRLEQMLLAEAHLASRIQHPNVVSTIELGEQDETLFLVMEWADAEPMSTVVKESADGDPLPLEIGVNIIAQACKGAHSAHELTDEDGNTLGVVHRDISPQNVLVTYAGVVKLVDFGIAKATQRASSMTEDGEVKGKLAYMSPEQVKGESVDRRTDVFALGTMLYLVTTGQHPFKGAHPGETLAKLFSAAPLLPPSRVVPDYPKALEQVVLKALSKDRDKRFDTAHDMLLALEEAVPESRGIEAQVAEYMRGLSGGQGEQRRRHIRTAGELLDKRQAGALLSGGTSTSLAAMSIGSTGTHSRVAAQTLASANEVSFKNPTSWRWAGAAVVAAGALAGILLGQTNSSQSEGISPDAAAANQPLLTTPGATAVEEVQPTPPTPPVDVDEAKDSVDDATEVAAEKEREEEKRKAKPKSVRVRRRVAPRAPATAVEPDLKPPTFDKAPPADDAEKVSEKVGKSPKSKANSWDPSTFGGRL